MANASLTRAGRRASGTVRRLPRIPSLRALGTSAVLKSAAGVAVITGVSIALAAPSPEAAEAMDLPAASAALAQTRTAAALTEGSSRSLGRQAGEAATPAALAVKAPAPSAPQAVDRVGVAGVTAVAKPKPRPTPTATAASETQDSSSAGSSGPSAANRSYSLSGSAIPGLTPNAARVYLAVKSAFGISNIGGLRPGDPGDHGSGRAIDVMITSQAQGDAVAAFALANMGKLNIHYVIWRQRIWTTSSPYWRGMEDRGSPTANHYDHVHISVF